MDQRKKDELRRKPKTTCFQCHSIKSYTNPMERCWECKNKFCYDHIACLQHKEGMSECTPLRSVCAECRKSQGYITFE